ncbi:MAG TPA: glycosyltransferase family 2 protein, partial [Tepidisphaeraceae bacterium]|nr:glycosyltransferase family 2 protein [Tepidisphaeraceae bacterium]
KPDGTLTGFFAADPGEIIEVDHVMGCNMSFRREILARLGGFRTDYPGISGVREDSDMCLRVKRLGYRIMFNPAARVDHVGAPQAVGRRFDWRYSYYASRNHAMLLVRNFGPFSAIALRSALRELGQAFVEFARRASAAAGHFFARLIGSGIGLAAGSRRYMRERGDPVRRPSASAQPADDSRPTGTSSHADHAVGTYTPDL